MEYLITIDVPQRDTILVTVSKDAEVIHTEDLPYEGAVDTRLLTLIDNLFHEHILDKFALISVKPGSGIDKTSLLYRIVLTLDAALKRGRTGV